MLRILLVISFCLIAATAQAKLEINSSLRIADLTSSDGSLYLFRYISQPYKPGKVGIVAQHSGFISYTINPLIFLNGHSFGYERTAPHIIVSRHKPTDRLFFVKRNASGLGENPLQLSTTLADFATQYEVEVPVGQENVVLVMPIDEFFAKTKGTQGIATRKDYAEFLKRVFRNNLPAAN